MYVVVFLLLMYLAIVANWQGWIDFDIVGGERNDPWFYLSITSVLLVVLYMLSVRHLAADNGSQGDAAADDAEPVTLSVRAIVVRFILTSIGIVAASIVLTYITDEISTAYNLGAGLAGALFLGVATSLPEVTSTISLFRMRSFDIAFGNIAGSNVFNFSILTVADLLYAGSGVYDFSDGKVVNLTVFGIAATLITMILLRCRTPWCKALCCAATIACYIAFLVV